MQTKKEYLTERSIVGLHSESVGEYSLPDYNTDVKRVLMISPRVCPSAKFMNESGVEFSGAVFYDVVYLDSENSVCSASFSTDYEIGVKTDRDIYEDSMASTSITGYSVRLLGPRKLSAKCSLGSNVRILERRNVEILGDAFDEHEPEVLSESARVISSLIACGKESEHREELLELEGAIEDEVTILSSGVRAELAEPVVSADGAELKGELLLSLLYKNADEPIAMKSVRVPYSSTVDAEGLDTCASVITELDVSALKCELTPTESGVSLALSFAVVPRIRGIKNESLELIKDAYLKEYGTSNEYNEMSYTEHVCTDTYEGDFSATVPISEVSEADLTSFAAVGALVHTEDCTLEDDIVRVKGEIRFSAIGIAESSDGCTDYSNVKFTVPFEEKVNISCQTHDNLRIECHAEAFNEKMEVVENNILASCGLAIHLTLNSQRRQRCLGASYLTDEEFSSEEAVVTVYYPDSRESAFDVAKKFHTSVRKIAEDNAMSDAVFASIDSPVSSFGHKKLLIK